MVQHLKSSMPPSCSLRSWLSVASIWDPDWFPQPLLLKFTDPPEWNGMSHFLWPRTALSGNCSNRVEETCIVPNRNICFLACLSKCSHFIARRCSLHLSEPEPVLSSPSPVTLLQCPLLLYFPSYSFHILRLDFWNPILKTLKYSCSSFVLIFYIHLGKKPKLQK